MDKLNKIFEKYSVVFWIFMIGSFIGFVHENLLTLLKGHYVLRQGLLYEPLIPIYGVGLLVFYFAYNKLDLKKFNIFIRILIVFLIGFFLGGFTEYMCSYVQQELFGTVSWDYSKMKFNIGGRTSLFLAFCWGIAGTLVYLIIVPLINKYKYLAQKKYVKVITCILTIVFLFDAFISSAACLRQDERIDHIKATDSFERFLDNTYPDKVVNRVYNNAKHVKR